jgi:hypothetical protein
MLHCVLIPLHNIYFGKRLVLLTSQVDYRETLLMTPAAYAAALSELLSGEAQRPAVTRMLVHLKLWLGTGDGSIPLHVALLVILIASVFLARTFTVRLFTVVACALQIPLLFWRPESRFGLLSWLMAVLAVVAFAYREGVPNFRDSVGRRPNRERRPRNSPS